jgi:site-specific DNA-methyltransferase (adenine-specific)
MSAEILHGDCREVLDLCVADNSIDAVVTDPPYGLGFMGKDWDHGVPGAHFWAEALRVAKPGAHLLAFGGTRTYHRLACAIEDAGWGIRDCLMWIYGSGFPKSKNLEGGRGTALKPAWEPIILARKALEGTVEQNAAKYGTGVLNIYGCRTNAGRWPANLVHDGSDEVVRVFPQSNGQQGDLVGHSKARKSQGIYGDMPAARDALRRGDTGSAARFFYCAKTSKKDRDEGCEMLPPVTTTDGRKVDIENPYLRTKTTRRNSHPTVKPTELMRYLCRLVTRPSGVILDPFMGSGSTGKAAALEGFRFIGIELEAEYVAIARARIAAATPARPTP